MTQNKIHIAVCDPYLRTKGGGEKCAIATAEALSNLPNAVVSLLVYEDPKNFNKRELEEYFKADLHKVTIKQIKKDPKLVERYNKYSKRMPLMFRTLVESYIEYKAFREHKIDIFINNFYKSNIFNPANVGIYFCMFPQKLAPPTQAAKNICEKYYRKGLNYYKRKLSIEYEPSRMLSTYQKVISISSFTQKWVTKSWGVDSEIVYPICEDMHIKGYAKKKLILNVGRFFAHGDDKHQKKQDALLDAFIEMKDLHDAGWELHFAGGIARDTEAMEYCLKLVLKAKNYPVFFHFNTSFSNLQKLYNQASIYWHATGYGLDEDKYPEQQEHFGITSVEAMSAGAIPVVLNAAGQKDTVNHTINGFLWDEIKEMQRYTRDIANDIVDIKGIRQNAVSQAKKFDKLSYQKHMTKIVISSAKNARFDLDYNRP